MVEVALGVLIVMMPLLSTDRTVDVAKPEVEVANTNIGDDPPALPLTESVPKGEEVPIPTFPFPNTVNRVVVERFPDVEDAIMNSGLVPARPELSWMESLAEGEVAPMPTLLEVTVNVGVEEYPT